MVLLGSLPWDAFRAAGNVVLILLLGYLYFKLAGEAYALVSIGLISFAAVAQFAPVMIGGLYWRNGRRDGAVVTNDYLDEGTWQVDVSGQLVGARLSRTAPYEPTSSRIRT